VSDMNSDKLRLVLDKYGVPDPKIVGKLPRGNIQLDYVGHAEITKILIEIDPLWDWKPLKIDDDGLPSYRVENGMAHMAGALTLLGHTRLAVGSAPHNKQDLLKELISDFLRNGAMRFGIALSLWSKEEWSDSPSAPVTKKVPGKKPASKPQENFPANPVADDEKVSRDVLERFFAACRGANLDPQDVADKALVTLDDVTVTDLDALRSTFKEMISK
jgi:hypothetical protein